LVHHVYDDLRLETDAFSDVMGGRLMGAVLRKQEPMMRSVFNVYACADQSLAAVQGTGSSTMNIKEMGELCEEAALLDTKFGSRELIAAWVRVNIDDELYEQDEEGNTSSELVYDEFAELVARIFYGREWLRLPLSERNLQQVELGFNSWLEGCFLPAAQGSSKMVAARKKASAMDRRASTMTPPTTST
jgi:hypothetical protein